jgi:hypothetical protein
LEIYKSLSLTVCTLIVAKISIIGVLALEMSVALLVTTKIS